MKRKRYRIKKIRLIPAIVLVVLFFGTMAAQGQTSIVEQVVTAEQISKLLDGKGETIPLKDALKSIEKSHNISFLYQWHLIENKKIPETVLTSDSLPADLARHLDEAGLIYRQHTDNTYLILRKEEEPEPEAVQQEVVRGRVTDAETGEPLPGVNVIVSGPGEVTGSVIGTQTDADGVFSIDIPEDLNTLVFSFIGYETLEVNIEDKREINIVMHPVTIEGEELVVVGYGTVEKRDLTGAVSSVDGSSFTDIPNQRVDQMLQGRAAGVDVKSIDGSPGAGTTIRIRGSRSINASNEPLYVIDGIVGAGDLNTLNPDDIESIDILKDASAAAIYGSRASNGVVIITTKQGQSGRDRVSFSASYGVSKLMRTLDMMGVEDYIPFINEAYTDAGGDVLYPDDSILDIVGTSGTDWIDETIEMGSFADVNLGISGGGDRFTYRLSGNFVDQTGIVVNSGYRRYQGRLNLTREVSSKLDIGASLNISHYEREPGSNINFGSNWGWSYSMITLPPTMPVYKEDGTFESYNPVRYIGGGHVNTALATGHLTTAITTDNSYIGSIYANLKITENFLLKSSLGATNSNNRYNFYRPSYMPLSIINNAEYGNALSDINTRQYIVNENTLTFTQTLGEHNINAVGGFSYQKDLRERMYIRGDGLTNDIVRWNDFESVPQDQRSTVSNFNENIQIGAVGRVAYDFSKKYYLTFTSRYDGASNFASKKKWAYFPSVAARWRMSEESFYKNSKFFQSFLNDLSFRASYGVSGNQAISNYQSLPTLSPDANGYIIGGNPSFSYTQGRLSNDDLSWETTSQLNVGADLEFLEGRINLSANYYDSVTEDLLLNVQVPRQTGYASRLINIGKTNSSGFEFEANATIISKTNFTWSTVVNVATNKQEVLDLGPLVRVALDNNDYGATTNFLEVGVPIGAHYGVKYMGTWKNQQEIDEELSKPEGERTLVSTSSFYRPGKPRYFDTNGDGKLNQDDYQYLGTPHPKIYGGIGNTLQYKNLTLDFFLQFVQGNSMWNHIEFFVGSGTYLTNQMSYMKNRWTPENPDSDIPGVNSRDNIPNTRFLHDASFLRLKSLNLSYDLSQHLFDDTDKRLALYFSGTNLLLLTKYNGFDPEVNAGGTSSTVRAKDDGRYPNSATFSVGINLEF